MCTVCQVMNQWLLTMNETFQHGRLEVAKILVGAGAIVDAQDKYGDKPVVMSCTDEVRSYLESVQDN